MTKFGVLAVTDNTSYVYSLGHAHGHFRSSTIDNFISRFPKKSSNFVCYTNDIQTVERKYLKTIGFSGTNTQSGIFVHFITKEDFIKNTEKFNVGIPVSGIRYRIGEIFYRIKVDNKWYNDAIVTEVQTDPLVVTFRLLSGRIVSLKPVFNNGHNQTEYNVQRRKR